MYSYFRVCVIKLLLAMTFQSMHVALTIESFLLLALFGFGQ